jgi:hypothetical protein
MFDETLSFDRQTRRLRQRSSDVGAAPRIIILADLYSGAAAFSELKHTYAGRRDLAAEGVGVAPENQAAVFEQSGRPAHVRDDQYGAGCAHEELRGSLTR